MTTRTKSQSLDAEINGEPERLPCLFLVLDALRPTEPPVRFPLAATDEVVFGRADAGRHFERSRRRLEIRLPDPWMSRRHASIRRESSWWVVEDNGSKNGTVLNGRPVVKPALLSDGDVLELQHGSFVFRNGADAGDEDYVADGRGAVSPHMVTVIPTLSSAFENLRRIGPSPVTVMLHGETGTGKEVVARAIHGLSDHRPGSFVGVNCGAIPSTLVESELFGSRRGAFSGATERPGLVRAAEGGTLFLDEIADLPLTAQAALLRVLQERKVVPLGGTDALPVDIRVISASHEDLPKLVTAKRFRDDLYQRLAGHEVTLPPLRERREDLGILIGAILRNLLGRKPDVEIPTLRLYAARALLLYHWPGNIRELEQVLSAALVLAGRSRIELSHLPEKVRDALRRRGEDDSGAGDIDEDTVLRQELGRLLVENRGNITAVARAMGKHRQQVQRWMRRLGLTPSDVETGEPDDSDG